ncbi:MAG: PfkB family carbohydrate kinase [Planctomycetota bacterium]|jgi:sulfofructose kinase|nr:PfkB family carbohydrate kinase [Planctomycetota bacterium]
MEQKRILCVGNAAWDQIFVLETLPTGAGKYFSHAYSESGGGPAGTASVAISRLGGKAKLWSRIGDDGAGDRIAAELTEYGVELPAISRLKGVASSLAGIWVDAGGERIIVNYLDPKFPQNADWLPLGEVGEFDSALADIRWPAGAEAVLRAAAAAGVPSVLDGDRAPGASILATLAPLAAHAVFSEGGLAMLTGEMNPEAGLLAAGSLPGVNPYVTLGDRGCLWLDKGRIRAFPAFKVEAADTTGAGDVFHGAFALALAEGMEIVEGLRFASGAAALKCTRPGGRAGIPDRAALDAFLKRNPA